MEPAEQQALLDRYAAVKARLAAACAAAGRPGTAVRLVAVSKFHDVAAIRTIYDAGQRDFGENYVQELDRKFTALADLSDLRMRFIGHLQRNKARVVVGHGCPVDTIDSLALGQALARHAQQRGTPVEGLIQVNVGREAQKAGVLPEDLADLLGRLRALSGLQIRGLMALPPATAEAEQRRPYFQALAVLARQHGLSELSMGMTDDMEVAVAEGATMVRLGTAIFGPRPA